MTALGVCRRGNAARKKAASESRPYEKLLQLKKTALVHQLRLRLTNAKYRERTLKCTLQKAGFGPSAMRGIKSGASFKSKNKRNEKLAVVGTALQWWGGRRRGIGSCVWVCVLVLSVCSVRVAQRGLPGSLSLALRENMMLRRRAFTESNSEVETMYSSRAGKNRGDFLLRVLDAFGRGGCVEKTLDSAGRRFSSACTRSKKVM